MHFLIHSQTNMRKISHIISVIIIGLFLSYGGTHAYAQTNATQKALEGVKESIGTLVNAKDENNPNEEVFRVETFKKVVDFSILEAKDLKVKFLASFENPKDISSLTLWRDDVLSRINAVITYYEAEKKIINDLVTQKNSDGKIKEEAEKFKVQRETQFIPLSEEIGSFLLIEQQKESVVIAEKRREKIQNDISKLKKSFSSKKTQPLETSLDKAGKLISEARESHSKAQLLFQKEYIYPFEITKSTTTPVIVELNIDKEIENSATTTPIIVPSSIRDLAGESLIKIKGAYQIFIEMSNLVRKLFI